jgi:hypothetical protein
MNYYTNSDTDTYNDEILNTLNSIQYQNENQVDSEIVNRINDIISKKLKEKRLHKKRNQVIKILFNMNTKKW